ncbi:hypothetical protein INT46_007879 [Mucor plumbeus]|uniref:Uncharacterized protein n=1 Tax=Mucor plumbeus TaxID=97098 RepID=A0A8H7RNP2_9FUNG|nr:hypothetical protein INT46_007879 [Mucor plumbeus]
MSPIAIDLENLTSNDKSTLSRLEVLEGILCSTQKTLTESQAVVKINDLQETTQSMESAIASLQEKVIDLQSKKNNYRTIVASINRLRKNYQLFESRLDLVEKNEQQPKEGAPQNKRNDTNNKKNGGETIESRVNLLEEALFSVQAFEPNAKLASELKVITEKSKSLEVKVKFLQKKLTDSQANEINLRVDVDKLDRRTICIEEDLEHLSDKTKKRLETLEKNFGTIMVDKEDDSKEYIIPSLLVNDKDDDYTHNSDNDSRVSAVFQ